MGTPLLLLAQALALSYVERMKYIVQTTVDRIRAKGVPFDTPWLVHINQGMLRLPKIGAPFSKGHMFFLILFKY